ncbi:flavin reductase family protein [Zavarzinia compransoris]|uniref:flavin reductase family protein n=1 Tax=Zavarzinia marina TaxID=2911065 RepID=UPI001F2A126E|nr:flavin reductase family protein [Zavarzinia marina]MCF4164266.1 flavin reductase family protein [Zavarzinia marina]
MSKKSFDFADLAGRDQYKLLIGTVVPRPIAWVTTVDGSGRVNAAPFSFFNVLSSEPAIVALGLDLKADGTAKDTTRNIRETGEFTVNIVSNALVEAMTVCAIPFPHGTEELAEAGLTTAPGLKLRCPYIKEARAALECRLFQDIALPTGRAIILGEVVAAHVDDCILTERLHVDAHGLDAVGRMGGEAYASTRYLFDLKRLTVEGWAATHDPGPRRPHPAWTPRGRKD